MNQQLNAIGELMAIVEEYRKRIKHRDSRIAELESQLAAMQQIIDGYKDDIRPDTKTEKQAFNDAANAWHRKAAEDSKKIKDLEAEMAIRDSRIAELEAQLATERERERWVPVTERLPGDGRDVIVADEYGNSEPGWYTGGQWICDIDEPTHWRELPLPPKEDACN